MSAYMITTDATERQRIYAGRSSNHTKGRILKQSPLIEVFKNIRISLENMFALQHRTYKHSPPRLERTFRKLACYMQNTEAHTMIPGRKSAYIVADTAEVGKYKLFIGGWSSGESGPGSQSEESRDAEGVTSVNAEDGDLDV